MKAPLDLIQHSLRDALGSGCEIKEALDIEGGCINSALTLKTGKGPFFVKWNTRGSFPDMLEKEALGLTQLRQAEVPVPGVIGHFADDDYQILILEYLDSQDQASDFWSSLGSNLARLHQVEGSLFGLEYDNYIGSLKQSNDQSDSWASFFVNQRIRPLIYQLKDGIPDDMRTQLDELCELILCQFSDVRPRLLHGDLWNGNFMAHQNAPFMIDPAIYFGHPEVDLAMTKLFGGFQNDFYNGYKEVRFLEEGWQNRLEVWNLYPVLVHVKLFGQGYIPLLRAHISASFQCFYTYYI